ncbi:hypothetical protein BaRGS_00031415, partial [Batillaria attramentaria]
FLDEFPVDDFPVNDFPVIDFSVNDFPVNDFPVNDFPVIDFPDSRGYKHTLGVQFLVGSDGNLTDLFPAAAPGHAEIRR